ncbi:hypothetical protein BJV78DRAFT_1164887 [Lactifluus subvellereus]|nr:hypothetical protein BJV78DRAFT_1164887 [Lactifluus subvellereus]
MSSTTIMDSYDAPMLDYSGDSDVHMHTTLSSPKPWTQPEAIMEEDVHPIHLPNPFPSPLPQQDVEVDMDYYYNENVEYEMADGEVAAPDAELVDIDVYDAPREEAFAASTAISHSAGSTDQDLNGKPLEAHYPPSDNGVAADNVPPISHLKPPFRQSAEPELLTPSLPQAGAIDERDATTSDQASAALALQAGTSTSEVVPKDTSHKEEDQTTPKGEVDSPAIAAADGTSNTFDAPQPLDDSESRSVPEFSAAERESSTIVPETVTVDSSIKESNDQAEAQDGETHGEVQGHGGNYEGEFPGAALDGTEVGEPEHQPLDSHEQGDNGDPYEISEGVYIEPPPPVLLELPSSPDHTDCTLFNTLEILHSDDSDTNAPSPEVPVLLQSRPTLYYETLNDVFEALRQDERIQSLPEFVDGEMIIDAYDLQLVVSEDNVHAREVSLHDLNVLHHGLGLIGPLRLRLRTVVSRFIHRYRSLQAQTTRLNVARTTSHPTENSDDQTYANLSHERDPGDNQAVNDDEQTERELTGDAGQEGLKGGVDEPEDTKSPYNSHAELQDGEPERQEEAYDESEQYADAQEYPHSYEDGTSAQEETDQVVDANDESESVLDADAIHEGSADPESTEYQEHEERHEEEEVSGDVEAPSVVAASTPAKENISPYTEFDHPTEAREAVAAGESTQFNESEERQAPNDEFSGSGSDYGDEKAADEFTEDAEAEADVTGEDSVQSADPENSLQGVANEEDAISHDGTNEYTPQAETPTPALSTRGEFSEPENPYHHTEEDEEDPESWELDDGFGVWEETVDGDDLDAALLVEPDAESTGSSTLSEKTASIASKRSFTEIDESEFLQGSSSQNPKKTRTR